MRLKYTLFLALLSLSALLIATMYAFNSWNFNRGFIDYLNEVESEKLDTLAGLLADEYATTGGWVRVANNDRVWNSFTRFRAPNEQTIATGSTRKKPKKSRDDADKKPGSRRDGPPRNGGELRVILADASKTIVRGPARLPSDVVWRPIDVEDNTVGYLGSIPRRELSGTMDRVFAAQQTQGLGYAAIALTGLSALLAAILSTHLVKPIVTIKHAVSSIRSGDFKHRIVTSRKDELGDLANDINHMALSLEKNQKARQQWIAEISHELRTPVAVLRGEIEAIQDGVKELNHEAVESLHSETLRLSRLINDLHDLSSSDIGSLNYRMDSVDIAALIRSRVQAADAAKNGKEISMTVNVTDSDLKVFGDEQRLAQLFDNLVQNSLRYTHSGGEISINIGKKDNDIQVVWSDSSPGVTDEQLPRLFETLYRTEESRNRESGGSGLGLAIVKKIVDAHQGSILADHSPKGGLTLDIRLPQPNRGST
ncbi:MAG: HAMP domain-containing protein [Gammaproteobacteria bacterium]|nr:HAMP domain-containing protein [Gammaproteobacteria bacterium]